MPFDDPDPTDPQMLVGVMLPSGPEAMRDMAYVFAEEFARMGYAREQILRLFRSPFYGAAHGAYRALGPAPIAAIVGECVAVWGRVTPVDREPPSDASRFTRDASRRE
jgi:hypothetical protein